MPFFDADAGVAGAGGGGASSMRAEEADMGGESGSCLGLMLELASAPHTLPALPLAPSSGSVALCGSSKKVVRLPCLVRFELLPRPTIVLRLFLLPEARCSMSS